MPCTTILVGKAASYDGSTLVARNEDSGSGEFESKKCVVIQPEDQPKTYTSVLSKVKIPLPKNPMRYTCMPNASDHIGVWGAVGVNEANVSMTATETLTSNERVLGADPLVVYKEKKGKRGDKDYQAEEIGGIGEEDMVTLVLPYIKSAREGVVRLGELLEKYGTYEMNGIAFQDVDEIWWLETIGGHHWMARRVPDDCYVTMPNQLGLDRLDLDDALGEQKEYMCSKDLREFIQDNYLDLTLEGEWNPREAFGSASDADHVYNTPRAWVIQRYLNPHSNYWDGPDADYTPESDDIPWCRTPERKITVEDVKYLLSHHYQGTPYDPYGRETQPGCKAAYRPIGINRNDQLAIVQIRPYLPEPIRSLEWVAFGSNVYNAVAPFYTNVNELPAYLNTPERITTESSYWMNRLIAALADPYFHKTLPHVERFQEAVQSQGHALVNQADKKLGKKKKSDKKLQDELEAVNEEVAAMLRKETDKLLDKVLFDASSLMKNSYSRSDH